MGRKSTYNEALAIEICERVSQGEALPKICKDPRFPHFGTIYRWLADNDTFHEAFARAREAQMHTYSQEIIEIADDTSDDYVERIGKNGETERAVDHETVQRSKLRIDTRWRLMSTLARGIYGDKVDVNLSGAVEISTLSDAELEARTRARLVTLGVEVAAPLLLPMPGSTSAPTPVPVVAPVITVSAPAEPTGPGSSGKRPANDLLGLGPAA